MLEFEWDDAKAARNLEDHNVSFQEAITAFYDEDGLDFDDPTHSEDEERFWLIARSSKQRILHISFTYRRELTVRLISAREAGPKVRRKYLR